MRMMQQRKEQAAKVVTERRVGFSTAGRVQLRAGQKKQMQMQQYRRYYDPNSV